MTVEHGRISFPEKDPPTLLSNTKYSDLKSYSYEQH